MVFMRQEGLVLAALLVSVRASWKVAIYYINRALLKLKCYAFYLDFCVIFRWSYVQWGRDRWKPNLFRRRGGYLKGHRHRDGLSTQGKEKEIRFEDAVLLEKEEKGQEKRKVKQKLGLQECNACGQKLQNFKKKEKNKNENRLSIILQLIKKATWLIFLTKTWAFPPIFCWIYLKISNSIKKNNMNLIRPF